jgi:hypothetical protein
MRHPPPLPNSYLRAGDSLPVGKATTKAQPTVLPEVRRAARMPALH